MPEQTNREAAEAFIAAQRECEKAKSMGDLRTATLGAAAIALATDLPERLLKLEEENERLRKLLRQGIRGLKHVGTFRCKSGDDPHPLDCTLAGRVAHVFGAGMTRSIALCREFDQDPEFVNKGEHP